MDTQNADDLFKMVKPGDIAYCHMPYSQSVLENIEPEHRARPYLILSKDETTLLGVPGSHKPDTKTPLWQQLKLDGSDYSRYFFDNDWKSHESTGYYNMKAPVYLEKKHLISLSVALPEHSLQRAARILKTIRYDDGTNLEITGHPYEYQEGDYLSINSSGYFAAAKDLNFIYAAKAERKKSRKSFPVQLASREIIYVDPSHVFRFPLCGKYKLEGFSNMREVKRLGFRNRLSGLQFYYRPGTVFMPSWNEDAAIYLFSQEDQDYFIYEEDLSMEMPEVFNVHKGTFKPTSQILLDEEIQEAAEFLLASDQITVWQYRSILYFWQNFAPANRRG